MDAVGLCLTHCRSTFEKQGLDPLPNTRVLTRGRLQVRDDFMNSLHAYTRSHGQLWRQPHASHQSYVESPEIRQLDRSAAHECTCCLRPWTHPGIARSVLLLPIKERPAYDWQWTIQLNQRTQHTFGIGRGTGILQSSFLAKKICEYEPDEVTGTWLEALVPERTRAPTSTQDEEDPLKVFSNVHSTMETAVGGLERFIGAAHHAEKDRKRVREILDTQQLGQRALHWLLNSEAYKRYDLMLYPKSIKLAAHALTAQKADDHLWRLMLVTDLPASFSTGELYVNAWESQVLRALVEACVYWAPDHEALNRSFACFKRAFVPVAKIRRQAELYVPKAKRRGIPEVVVSENEVVTCGCGCLRCFLSVADRVEPGKVLRLLFREEPHVPAPSYRSKCRSCLGPPSASEQREQQIRWRPTPYSAKEKRKEAQCCSCISSKSHSCWQRQDRLRDARWVLDFGRSELPSYFTKGRENPYKGNTETLTKRLPTEAEMKAGIPADESGHVGGGGDDEQHLAYWRAAKAAEYDRRMPSQR